MKEKVLISGGTGLVGTRLTDLLIQKGYEVAHLSRSSSNSSGVKTIVWDVNKMQLNHKSIEDYQYIVQLAGAGIVDEPWTEERKKVIIDSRVKSSELLHQAISKNKNKPKAFVSASAIGYYGLETTEHIYKETDGPGNDFLAETCVKWESSIDELKNLKIPVSKIRIGLVLSENGGALKEIAKPVKFGFGAALGSGEQYMPWIHIDDLCNIFIHAMENKLEGAFNAGAPNQVNNKTFTKILAKVFRPTIFLPNVPAFMMKLILVPGTLVLEGSRVSPEKIEKTGFEFDFTDLEEALREIYK